MLKTVDIVLVALMLTGAAWTFSIKHDAELLEDQLRVVERQIAQERDTINLLEADWSLLNQPYRLQRLVADFETDLALKPFESTQIVGPDELPAAPVLLLPEPGEETGGFAAVRNAEIVR